MYKYLTSIIIISFSYLAHADSNGQSKKNAKLSLESCLATALANNAHIQRTEKERDTEKLKVASTRSRYFPSLKFESSVGTAKDKAVYTDEVQRPTVNRDHNFYNSDLVANFNLFKGFSDSNAVEASELELDIANLAYSEAKAEIFKDVALHYFKVQVNQRKIQAEKEAEKLRQKQLREVQNRNRAGSATRLEVLQAEYALQNTAPSINRLLNEMQLDILKLQQLMGQPFSQKQKLSDDLETAFASSKTFKMQNEGDLLSIALKSNHKLLRKQSERKRLRAELYGTNSEHWPSVDLRFTASSRAFFKDEVFDEDVRTYSGAIVLSLPLFGGLKSFSDREAIEQKIISQKLAEKEIRDQLLYDITKYAQQLRVSLDELKSEKTNLKLAEESIKQSEDLYRAGSAKLTDVLDAYTLKFDAIKNLADAMYHHVEATLWLQFLTGSNHSLSSIKRGNG